MEIGIAWYFCIHKLLGILWGLPCVRGQAQGHCPYIRFPVADVGAIPPWLPANVR